MNPARTTTDRSADRAEDDRLLRAWAGWGLGLLLPTAVFCTLVAFSSERAGRCITYGENCSATPGWLPAGSFWASLAAGVIALMWPRARWTVARLGAVVIQWCAQLMLAASILSFA
ncbi:hypothetical protein [Streptomyces naphthomycinicus]|uniref:hypothetical protein n=1 Tax=Streptomyces naphthomycinicus TaxID=2872625 RepID=UPI001CEDC46C|nr:hypothetical protein [Streptomyces sp. TML10]